MQRVDVIADGRTVNSNQRSDNPDLWLRVKRLMQTAERIEIRRHVPVVPTPTPTPVPPPPAPTPPPDLARSLQRVMYFATVTDDSIRKAIDLGPTWRYALTADPTYQPTANQIAYLREHAQDRLDVWAQPLEVSLSRIRQFAKTLGVAEPGAEVPVILQAEDQPQLDRCLELGVSRIVGNPNAWNPAEREVYLGHLERPGGIVRRSALALVTDGLLAVAGECYTNVDGPWPREYSSQGIPIASEVIGVGKWAEAAHDYDAGDYHPDTGHSTLAIWSTVSVYAATYIRDWSALPR